VTANCIRLLYIFICFLHAAILTVVLLHIAVFGVLYFILKFWHEYTRDGNNVRAKKKDRVMSLDAFRG